MALSRTACNSLGSGPAAGSAARAGAESDSNMPTKTILPRTTWIRTGFSFLTRKVLLRRSTPASDRTQLLEPASLNGNVSQVGVPQDQTLVVKRAQHALQLVEAATHTRTEGNADLFAVCPPRRGAGLTQIDATNLGPC